MSSIEISSQNFRFSENGKDKLNMIGCFADFWYYSHCLKSARVRLWAQRRIGLVLQLCGVRRFCKDADDNVLERIGLVLTLSTNFLLNDPSIGGHEILLRLTGTSSWSNRAHNFWVKVFT